MKQARWIRTLGLLAGGAMVLQAASCNFLEIVQTGLLGVTAAGAVAIDEQRDLAVLKIETDKPLKPLALGTSGDLMQGETVVAIGNPLGYQHTVTRGVVSATNRKLEFDNGHEFTDLIQTDASINPGNSGGPLLNILGELIGINTAIRGDAQNIGFAIPVDQLRAVLPELLDVERRYRIVTGLKVKMQRGATISEVKPGSPAAQAKLEVGDKIVSIDGERIASDIDYHISLLGGTPGRILEVKVQRGEETKQTFLRLGERPRPDGAKLLKAHFGLSAEPMDANTAKLLGIRQPVGLTVTSVEANSPAATIGLRRGDIIIQIGRHQPRTMEDVGDLLEQVRSGQRVGIAVLRIEGRVVTRATAVLEAR